MARSQAEILAHLVNNAPRFVASDPIGVALLDALALLLRAGEVLSDTLRALVYRQTSAGEWLDEIGAEVGVARLPGESDAAYRERIVIRARGVTPDGIREELRALVARLYGAGYEVRLVEPTIEAHADAGAYADDHSSITLPGEGEPAPADPIWLVIPNFGQDFPTSAESALYAYADDNAHTDLAAAGDEQSAGFARYVAREVLIIVEALRAAGVAFGAEIVDVIQPAHVELLLDLPPNVRGSFI